MDKTYERLGSEAMSSSSSDFYAVGNSPTGPSMDAPGPVPTAAAAATTTTTVIVIPTDDTDVMDGSDCSCDMDVSVSSPISPQQEQSEVQHVGIKRKSSPTALAQVKPCPAGEDGLKKRKLSPTPLTPPPLQPTTTSRVFSCVDAVPVELWQHVFALSSPATLSRCLRVCKTFNVYLTKTKAPPLTRKDSTGVHILDSETIWHRARKTYFPNLPRPLARYTELKMIQLIGGKTCQFCDRQPVPSACTTSFNAGPGADGLRVDVQMLTSGAGPLALGLPYTFRTPDLHFVPEITRHMPGGIPSHLRLAKVYYNLDVKTVQEQFNVARSFGDGAAEEWRKGLTSRGKDAMADAARWEKWESQVLFGANLAHVLREYDLASFPQYAAQVQSIPAGVNTAQPVMVTNGPHPLPQPVQHLQVGPGPLFQSSIPHAQPVHRSLRNPHEIEAARHARRTEVERRCMELQPPLRPSALQHIESFQAAMQITTPMNDSQWNMLKPRIIAQREAAELIEHQKAEQMAALQAAIPSDVPDEMFSKPAKEVYDREYEQSQEPLRKRLSEYADEFINGQWHGGQGLDRDTSPSFAIMTLLHVRTRYLQDKEGGRSNMELPMASQIPEQGTPSPELFLSLDNMKWVYDNKVRKLTDRYRRELFVCAGCAEEKRPKWFAFEGLIQHYGAKHTTAFSQGNVVVHWQTAEWPDDPPFHTNPSLWIKMDRKISDHRTCGGARQTPRNGHGGPFVPPTSGPLLSENTMLINGSQYPPSGSNGHQASAGIQQPPMSDQHGQDLGYHYQMKVPAVPAIDVSHDARLKKLSTDAREVWDSLDGVRDLLANVRIQTIIQVIIVRFTERFHQRPPLDLLTDALANDMLMRPIKNAHGLACKLCVAGQTDGSANHRSYFARTHDLNLYNTSSLVTHFKVVHQPQEDFEYVDWAKDMIELPETQLIGELIRAPGMDDNKLALIAGAFPSAFPSPLPTIGHVEEIQTDPEPESRLVSRLLNRIEKKQKKAKKKGHADEIRDDSSESLPEPTENEYDPRRPIFDQKDQDIDPARFDTDIARRNSASGSQAAFNPLGLVPETLAALNSIPAMNTPIAQPAPAVDDRESRSPSVGCAEPTRITPNEINRNAIRPGEPDLAAIIAAITSRQALGQTATPPASLSNGSDSLPRPQAMEQYGSTRHELYRPQSRRSSGRYVSDFSFHSSAESPAIQRDQHDPNELPPALASNAWQFEHNRAIYPNLPRFLEPIPANNHVVPLPASHSPPRYQYVYEDAEPQAPNPSAPAPPPYHREGAPAPIQYIQLPADQQLHHQQRYAPAPRTIYVDGYGRPLELIPINAAPALVQYAPHPFELQRQAQQHYAGARADDYVAPAYQHQQDSQRAAPMYYQDVAGHASGYAQPLPTPQHRYGYEEDGRGSVPRP